MQTARFIKSYHPRSNIAPTEETIAKLLKKGWCGQLKKKGHRIQSQIFPDGQIVSFTKDGRIHTTLLPALLEKDIRAMAETKLLVLEGEWLKGRKEVHYFDVLHADGKTFSMATYTERHALLEKKFKKGPHIHMLDRILTLEECMEVMAGNDDSIEGLVFKSQELKGWSDTGIVRCLKVGIKHF